MSSKNNKVLQQVIFASNYIVVLLIVYGSWKYITQKHFFHYFNIVLFLYYTQAIKLRFIFTFWKISSIFKTKKEHKTKLMMCVVLKFFFLSQQFLINSHPYKRKNLRYNKKKHFSQIF